MRKKDLLNKYSKSHGKEDEKEEEEKSRVIYLGHLPEMFEEYELGSFLSQFGRVVRLRLSRSRKSARSRGYAFVEFEESEVATIVAETMSGYLMGQKRVVCHVVPPDKINPETFPDRNQPFVKIDWAAKHRKKVNAPKSALQMKAITERLLRRERQKRKKLKALGIDYDFPGYAASHEKFPVKDEEAAKGEEIDVVDNDEKADDDTTKDVTAAKQATKRKRKGSIGDSGQGKKKTEKGDNRNRKVKQSGAASKTKTTDQEEATEEPESKQTASANKTATEEMPTPSSASKKKKKNKKAAAKRKSESAESLASTPDEEEAIPETPRAKADKPSTDGSSSTKKKRTAKLPTETDDKGITKMSDVGTPKSSSKASTESQSEKKRKKKKLKKRRTSV